MHLFFFPARSRSFSRQIAESQTAQNESESLFSIFYEYDTGEEDTGISGKIGKGAYYTFLGGDISGIYIVVRGENVQNRVVAIGGFEDAYMRKLALYLSRQMDGVAQISIVRDLRNQPINGSDIVWVGSEEFIQKVKSQGISGTSVILAEDKSEDEYSIYRFQPRERIYQKLMLVLHRLCGSSMITNSVNKQRWIVMTTDSSMSQLLAFSLTAACILKERGRVLYLNLSACSGMKEVLQVEDGADLSDLVMEIRRDSSVCMKAFARKIEEIDCIFPPANPSVLYELQREDIAGIVQAIERETEYQYVLVAVGNTFCNCEFVFQRASLLLHLTRREDSYEECTNEWMEFIHLCTEAQNIKTELLVLPFYTMKQNGSYLLYEWKESALGQLALEYLQDIKNATGSNYSRRGTRSRSMGYGQRRLTYRS